jgi:hypothetical protein
MASEVVSRAADYLYLALVYYFAVVAVLVEVGDFLILPLSWLGSIDHFLDSWRSCRFRRIEA